MQPTKPLIIHTESSRGWGGQEIRDFAELKGMKDRGYRVALIASQKSRIYERAKMQGIDAYPVEFRSKIDPVSWLALYGLFKKLRPSIVNTHSSDDSWTAGPIARLLGVPLIIRTRHVSTPISGTFSYRHFPHLLLTTSETIRNDLMASGVIKQKILSLPTGIDLNRFQFNAGHREAVRNKYLIADNDVLVGNICVLRSWKGLDFFIETAAATPSNFKFMLVGDGPQLEALQNKSRLLNLQDRFIFTGYQEQVEQFFSALDIFFFTSYASEGVPQGLLQAVASGLSLVVCKLPSVIETLEGVEGVSQINHGDVAGAVDALVQAGSNCAKNMAVTEKNRELLNARYGIEKMLDTLESLYREYKVV